MLFCRRPAIAKLWPLDSSTVVSARRVRLIVVVAATLGTAAVVAIAGTIAFVGIWLFSVLDRSARAKADRQHCRQRILC